MHEKHFSSRLMITYHSSSPTLRVYIAPSRISEMSLHRQSTVQAPSREEDDAIIELILSSLLVVCLCVCVCCVKKSRILKSFCCARAKVWLLRVRFLRVFARWVRKDRDEKKRSLPLLFSSLSPSSLSSHTHVLLVFASYDGILYTEVRRDERDFNPFCASWLVSLLASSSGNTTTTTTANKTMVMTPCPTSSSTRRSGHQ